MKIGSKDGMRVDRVKEKEMTDLLYYVTGILSHPVHSPNNLILILYKKRNMM